MTADEFVKHIYGEEPMQKQSIVANGELIAAKDAEILALREALDGVRWCQNYDEYRAVPTYFNCAFCGQEKSDPEVHDPGCKIGKLFAKGEKHEPN